MTQEDVVGLVLDALESSGIGSWAPELGVAELVERVRETIGAH